MKTHPSHTSRRSGFPALFTPPWILFCLLLTGFPAGLQAENVDSEIVLLVDVTRPGLSNTQFSRFG